MRFRTFVEPLIWLLIVCFQQEPHRPWSPPVAPTGPGRGVAEVDQVNAKRPRDDGLMPLVIPVSVPVKQTDSLSPDHEQASISASWTSRPLSIHDMSCSDYKTSVIVSRRRSLRNTLSESTGQVSSQTDQSYQNIKGVMRCHPLIYLPYTMLQRKVCHSFSAYHGRYTVDKNKAICMISNAQVKLYINTTNLRKHLTSMLRRHDLRNEWMVDSADALFCFPHTY